MIPLQWGGGIRENESAVRILADIVKIPAGFRLPWELWSEGGDMKRAFLDSVIRGAEALAARQGAIDVPDAELLRRFATSRNEAAFAALVRRHGPLVWGVCRNLLPCDADAEDAFQATFLALVRSATSVKKTATLGGWLHGVAFRVAMKARRSAVRRRQREQKVAVPESSAAVADTAWDELQAAVHEEVSHLPEKLRLAFVLCCLQGKSQRDAAADLGWKIGTLSARLTQARQRLLDRLARRGLPAAIAAGAAVLGAATGGAAVPRVLIAKTLAGAGPSQAVITPSILYLARGATSMYLTRTKLIAAVVLLGALTTGVGTHFRSAADAQDTPKAKTPEAAGKVDLGEDKGLHFYTRVSEPKERWEYKFIPMSQAPKVDDFQTELQKQDRAGWEYCGTQDLLAGNKAMASPYLVFKRPNVAIAVAGSSSSDAAVDVVKALMIGQNRLKVLAEVAEATAQQAKVKAELDALTAEKRLKADYNAAMAAKLRAEKVAQGAEVEKDRANKYSKNVDAATSQKLLAEKAAKMAEQEKLKAEELGKAAALNRDFNRVALQLELKKTAEMADRAKTDEAKAIGLKEGMEAAKNRSVEIDKALQAAEERVEVYRKEGNPAALARAEQRVTILQGLSARAEKELLELQFGFTNSKAPTGR